MSGTPMTFEYIRSKAKAGRMGARLMAIVAEGDRGRVYLSPTPEMEAIARSSHSRMEAGHVRLPRTRSSMSASEYTG